jgi:hypothetical protein
MIEAYAGNEAAARQALQEAVKADDQMRTRAEQSPVIRHLL